MSCQINKCVSLKCDNDAKTVETIQSLSPADHILQDYNNIYSQNYMNVATDCPTVNFDNGFGLNPKFIDDELRVGKVGVHNGDANQLFTRPFLTIPYMGKGKHFVDSESDLLNQETTLQSKQCNSFAGVFLKNQFIIFLKILIIVPSSKVANETKLRCLVILGVINVLPPPGTPIAETKTKSISFIKALSVS